MLYAEAAPASVVYARLLLNNATGRIACLPGRPAQPLPQNAATAGGGPPATPSPKAKTKTRKSNDKAAALEPQPDNSSTAKLKDLQLPGTSLEWLLDTVAHSAADSTQRQLLSTLVGYHWHHRCFLPGNVVVMPLLGRRVLFEVCCTQGAHCHVLSHRVHVMRVC